MWEATRCLNEPSKEIATNKEMLAFFIALYMILFDPDTNVSEAGEVVGPLVSTDQAIQISKACCRPSFPS